nr:hypothetical protein [Tanacetum cinerariifolium]
MDVDIEKDDLNQKFLISLAPEWLMHTIVKEGVGYNAVPPPAADLYRSPKKDLSWTGLPKFVDDTVTDYSRPSPTVESTSAEGQNKHSTTAENGESTDSILSKPAVKFVKAGDKPAESPMTNKAEFVKAAERPTTDKVETAKKPAVRYAEMYRRTSKRRRVQRETTRSQNHAYMSPSHRSYGAPIRPSHRPAGHRPHGPPMRPQYRAPWVPTVNRNFPPVNRKLPTLPQSAKTLLVPILLLSPMSHALVADEETPTEFALMANTECKVFDNSLCLNECKKNIDSLNSKIKDLKSELSEANNYIYHYKLAVAQLEGRLTEYKEREVKYIEKIRTLEMYRASNLKCIKTLTKELDGLKLEKDGLDGKLAGLLKASKNLDHLIESQRSDQVKEGVGYNVVPPPAADLYLSPKKDLSWTGLPAFMDDTVTDYSRPSPTVASTLAEGQNQDSSTSKNVASLNSPKPFVKFVKPKDSQPESKSKEQETPKKSQVKYVEQYRHSNKKPKIKGNQRNWNNLKSYQLGPEFVLNKKACYNCGNFSHLANDCRRRVQKETTMSQNHTYKRPPPRSSGHRPHRGSMRHSYRPAGHRPHRGSMRHSYRPAGHRPHGPAMNPRRPTINSARPYKSFFNQAPSYETRPFLKTSALRT